MLFCRWVYGVQIGYSIVALPVFLLVLGVFAMVTVCGLAWGYCDSHHPRQLVLLLNSVPSNKEGVNEGASHYGTFATEEV